MSLIQLSPSNGDTLLINSGTFSTGKIIRTRNELVFFTDSYGNSTGYRWLGQLPHTITTNSPLTDGGINSLAWESYITTNLYDKLKNENITLSWTAHLPTLEVAYGLSKGTLKVWSTGMVSTSSSYWLYNDGTIWGGIGTLGDEPRDPFTQIHLQRDIIKYNYTITDNGETVVNIPYTFSSIEVYVNGVLQDDNSYSIVEQSLVFSSPLLMGDVIKAFLNNVPISAVDYVVKSDISSFIKIDDLKSTTGSKYVGLPNGTVYDAIKFVTPEMFKSDADIDDTNSFISALNSGLPIVANGNYFISFGIEMPNDTILTGNGTITQTKTGSFTWTINNLQSPWPMFKITSSNVKISGITFIPNFEAFYIDSGSEDVIIDKIKIQNKSGTLSSGINAWSCKRLTISNSVVRYCGAMGSYDSSTSKQIYGICNGIHIGSTDVTLTNNDISYNGLNGIFIYGATNMICTNNRLMYNGCSGIQHSPAYSTVSLITSTGSIISNNYCYGNYADGIDINWTGQNPLPLNASLVGNVCWLNGFFGTDTTKPTQDGGGITLRNVTNYTATGNTLIDNAGVSIYMTNPSNCIISSNRITNNFTNKEGIALLYSASDVTISSNDVSTKGSAFQVGGSMILTRCKVNNNRFISSASSAASYPSNTYTQFISSNNIYIGSTTINFYFPSEYDYIRFNNNLSSYGLYLNINFTSIIGLNITGSTPSSLVYMDGGTKNMLIGSAINNTDTSGTGVGFNINNSTRITVQGGLLQCSSGTGANYSGSYITSIDVSYSGSTSINSSATNLYYIGSNNWTSTQTYTVKPYDINMIQRT